jgi:tetratricopeptide (TPR) repeat protein
MSHWDPAAPPFTGASGARAPNRGVGAQPIRSDVVEHRVDEDFRHHAAQQDVERPMRTRALLLLPIALCLVVSASTAAGAAEVGTNAAIETAVTAVERGEFGEAIDLFEQLSDQAIQDPRASYHRALAYLQRADSSKRRTGDLGQAAAALQEAINLGDNDPITRRALHAVRKEISRERAQRGLDPVVVRPPLTRAFVNLVPENVWAVCSALGSLLLCLGLFTRRGAEHSQKRLIGLVLTPAGSLLLILCGAMLLMAHHYRTETQEAVVISAQAKLLDESGKPLTAKALDVDATAIPEGASVFVSERQGRLFDIRWGSIQAWVRSDDLRLLAR